MSVLDIISKGRVSYAFGVGHRAEEYEHFGIDMRQRGELADEYLALLRRLLTGRAGRPRRSAYPRDACTRDDGRSPCSSREAARRRRGVRRSTGSGSSPKRTHPDSRSSTNRNAARSGHEPGVMQFPVPGAPTTVFVADDVDRPGMSWDRIFFMTL